MKSILISLGAQDLIGANYWSSVVYFFNSMYIFWAVLQVFHNRGISSALY